MDRRRVAATDSEPLRVLVVDDDQHALAYVAALASRAGFSVETAADAKSALERFEQTPFDAAIIDQEMPHLSGIALVGHLRQSDATRSIYALMLTGHEDQETKLAALGAGFDDFVTKSTPEVEMIAKLTAARRIAARQRTMDVAIRELYGMATRDELTGLFNRRFFVSETERLIAQGTPVGVILLDLDAFKQVNDVHGHLVGDRVLRDLGALFHRSTRPEDVVARYGGDEFVMTVPLLGMAEVEAMGVRIARSVRALRWEVEGATISVGVSTGVASSRGLSEVSLARLLEVADRDMYKNKWLWKTVQGRSEPARVQPPKETSSPARDAGPPSPAPRPI